MPPLVALAGGAVVVAGGMLLAAGAVWPGLWFARRVRGRTRSDSKG